MKLKKIFLSIGILLITLLICLLFCRKYSDYKRRSEENSLRIKVLQDSIERLNLTSENQIAMEKEKNIVEIQSLNKQIEDLQEMVKKLQVAKTPKIHVKTDTIIREVIIDYNEGYHFPFSFDGWVEGDVEYLKDSIGMKVRIKNDISIQHKKDKKGRYVEVFDKNPYTTTKPIKSYYKSN